MSVTGRAVRASFDQVCATELQRLRRKTAALAPADQEKIAALTYAVARAISAELEAVLESGSPDGLDEIVARLFVNPRPAPGASPEHEPPRLSIPCDPPR